MIDATSLRLLDPCRRSPDELDTDPGLPGFGSPWHAQAFGAAIALSRAGIFTWAEWVECFSTEIRLHPQRDDETGEAAYYRQWLSALEQLIEATGAMSKTEIFEAAEHWRRSYLNTPHGRPIEFSRSWDVPHHEAHDDDHDHDHDHDHGSRPAPRPASVDPARRTNA